MSKLIAFCTANQEVLAGIGVLILPSLITALGRKPGPYTNAGIAALQWLLDRLSFLTHSNSPGTLKFPLTGSGPASQAADPVNAPRSAGFARVSVLAVLSLASTLLLAGCVTAWTAAEKAAPACYGISMQFPALEKQVSDCVTDVSQANWIGCAETAVTSFGTDKQLALCIYQAVALQIQYPNGGEVAYVPDAGAVDAGVTALERAVALTSDKLGALEKLKILQDRAQSGAVR